MFQELLRKHRADLNRAVANFRYERNDAGGLYLPDMKVQLGGVFRTTVNDGDQQIDANTLLFLGLDALLDVFFGGGTQFPAFYLAPFSNNTEPAQNLTAATIVSTLGEFTHYSEGARQTWTPGAVDTQAITNGDTPATITADATGGNVWGFWLTTASTKSSTTGQTPIAASKFASVRALPNEGDKLKVEYAFTAADA